MSRAVSAPGPKRVVYLSPHLDDVVWSCPGHVLDTVANGGHAVIATVFSASNGGALERTRKAEDRRAVGVLGADLRHLDHLDAPWRTPWWSGDSCGFDDLVCADTEPALVAAVADSLAMLFAELDPDLVVAPLGVGDHLDHRTVHVASAAAAASITSVWYEDRPYAFIDESVCVRLAALGFDVGRSDVDWVRYWRSFEEAPYVREFLSSPVERRRVVEHVASPGASAPSGEARVDERRLARPDLDRAEAAVLEYRSQLAPFIDTESLRERIRHERTWRRVPTPEAD